MDKVFVFSCVAWTALVASSCASTRNAATVADIGGEWNIIELNGEPVVPPPGQAFPFIGFDAGRGEVYGESGCNRMTGRFDTEAKPGTLGLGALGSTRMTCPDMTLERKVLDALSQVKKCRKLDGGQIALCRSSGRMVAVLQRRAAEPAPDGLDGRWIVCEAGGEAVPGDVKKKPFLEFDFGEKRMNGNAGCNVINGNIRTEEGNPAALSFTDVLCTMMMCPDMEVERRVLKALDAVRSFGRTDNGGAVLYDADNRPVLVLTRE